MRTIMCVSNGRGEQRSIQLTLWPVVTVMRDIAAIEAVFCYNQFSSPGGCIASDDVFCCLTLKTLLTGK